MTAAAERKSGGIDPDVTGEVREKQSSDRRAGQPGAEQPFLHARVPLLRQEMEHLVRLHHRDDSLTNSDNSISPEER